MNMSALGGRIRPPAPAPRYLRALGRAGDRQHLAAAQHVGERVDQPVHGGSVVPRDETQALTQPLPSGAFLPPGSLFAGGIAATFDYTPSPWFLLRLEYAHRAASLPIFSGRDGITSGADTHFLPPPLRQYDDRVLLNATLRL